jgi:hypothetical protein
MLLQLPDEAFLIWPNTAMNEEAAQVAYLRVLLDMYVAQKVRPADLTQGQTCFTRLEVPHAKDGRQHRRDLRRGGHNSRNIASFGRVLKRQR